MSRMIKFRAWHIERNEYFQVIEICFESKNLDLYCDQGFLYNVPFDEVILEQFIGLYDSTRWNDLSLPEQFAWTLSGNPANEWPGREIYEGDILKCITGSGAGKSGFIEFYNGSYVLNIDGNRQLLTCRMDMGRFKKAGNIHENPELIKCNFSEVINESNN